MLPTLATTGETGDRPINRTCRVEILNQRPGAGSTYRCAALVHVLPCPSMKTNVTLKLDADLLKEAPVVAAEEGRSISALLTDRLEAIVRERKAFDKARRRALARLRDGLDLQWTPPRSRDELHER